MEKTKNEKKDKTNYIFTSQRVSDYYPWPRKKSVVKKTKPCEQEREV